VPFRAASSHDPPSEATARADDDLSFCHRFLVLGGLSGVARSYPDCG
jgi:hypothetical protein